MRQTSGGRLTGGSTCTLLNSPHDSNTEQVTDTQGLNAVHIYCDGRVSNSQSGPREQAWELVEGDGGGVTLRHPAQ